MSKDSHPNQPLIVEAAPAKTFTSRASCDLVLLDKIRYALCQGLEGWTCEVRTVDKAWPKPEARGLKVQITSADIFRPSFSAGLEWLQGFTGPMQLDDLPRGPLTFGRRILNNLINVALVAGSSKLVLPYDLNPLDHAFAVRYGFSGEAGCALELPICTEKGDWSPQVQQVLALLSAKPQKTMPVCKHSASPAIS
jgi:hypothetical protein